MKIDFNSIIENCNKMIDVWEAEQLYKYACLAFKNKKSVLEIGGGYGCSTVVLANAAKEYSDIVHTIEPNIFSKLTEVISNYALNDYVKIYTEPSPWTKIKIDNIGLLFIDGNHGTKWVITDYQFWSNFVGQDGYIAFHDYNEVTGVRRAINIIKETDNLVEVYKAPSNYSRGIIIFRKG